MTRTKVNLLGVAAAGYGALLAAPAHGQALGDRFWIEISGYQASLETTVQVSSIGRATIGTEINGETDLGLDDKEILPMVHAGARLGGNWIVGAEFFTLHRDTTNTLARSITFDDVTYDAAASVTSGFNTDIYRFTIGYAFIRTPTIEIGGAIGLHATDVEASIEGEGRIGNASAQVTRRSKDFLAPLPTVGLFGHAEIVPRLTLGGRIDYLSLSIGDYDGRLINAEATIAYRLFRNVGVGAGYRLVNYRVGVDKERYSGRFRYEFSGPTVFLQFGF